MDSDKQPVGFPLPDWKPPPYPPREPLIGRYCHVEPLDPARHAQDLYSAYSLDREGRNFTYLTYEPFASLEACREWAQRMSQSKDPLFFALIELETGRAVGVASFMRIDPPNGVIEIGGLNFSPLMQRHRMATEAMYLMMKRVFGLGYRRYEWKCDSLNAPSRRAALRLGFTFEGIFRQAIVYKRRSRDTAWFSILDGEWPRLRQAFERWLDPDNFDEQGRQRLRLSQLTSGGRP